MKFRILSFLLLVFTINTVFSQKTINPDLLKKNWRAFWIYVPESSSNAYGVYKFRKEINLDFKPEKFIVHVSGDNHYKLYINGVLASVGPARGDLNHYNFESIDIAQLLKSGKNTIASIVWNDGEYKPIPQISARTAFILQGDSELESIVNTNPTWNCIQDRSYAPIRPDVLGYYAAQPGEFVNFNQSISGWTKEGFDDRDWKKAVTISTGLPKSVNSMTPNPWMLVQSKLPAMEMKEQRLQKIRRVEGGGHIPSKFPLEKSAFTIPANSKVVFLLDQSHNTNAYPVLEFGKGKNANIVLQYAESLYDMKTMEKGDRNVVEGKKMIGVKDSLISNGNDYQNFTSLYWRTFRYVQISVETKDQPLEIKDFYGIFTGYPFSNNANFITENKELNKILEIGWRTARMCAVDTYFDCPYYEQLQYVGDTRIQAMVSYFNSGDDRLAKQAIDAINNSQLAEGITMSRYPSNLQQIIPPFSLLWIGMLKDFYKYRPDANFVKSHLPGMRKILSFYENYQQQNGTLENAPYWNFTDWPENSKGWKLGAPPLNKDGGSSVLDFQLLAAYQWAAELENDLGIKELSNSYNKKAEKLKESIKAKYWDNEKNIFADNDSKKNFSQVANTLAILTETITGKEATELCKIMLSDVNMARGSIYFRYYINQALNKVGLGDDYLNQLEIWKDYIALGATTWGEDSQIKTTRSDCHAWGASPNIEFFRIVLGIDSDAPGFKKVKIEPHLGSLTRIGGSIPHSEGEIKVNYEVNKKGKLKALVVLPSNLTGTFVWKGKIEHLESGENRFEF